MSKRKYKTEVIEVKEDNGGEVTSIDSKRKRTKKKKNNKQIKEKGSVDTVQAKRGKSKRHKQEGEEEEQETEAKVISFKKGFKLATKEQQVAALALTSGILSSSVVLFPPPLPLYLFFLYIFFLLFCFFDLKWYP